MSPGAHSQAVLSSDSPHQAAEGGGSQPAMGLKVGQAAEACHLVLRRMRQESFGLKGSLDCKAGVFETKGK